MMRWLITTLTLFGILFPALAAAQPTQGDDYEAPSPDPEPANSDLKARAEALKAKGDTAMLDLRYDDALAAYEQAYALEPNPALLYNQGRAHQARGSYPEALGMLRRFDAEAPPDLKARVPRLAELIAEVEGKVTSLTVEVNVPGASVRVRGLVIGTTPLAATLVNSGSAKITATKAGYRVVEKVETLVGGQPHTVKLVLVPLKKTGLLQVRAVAGARVFVDGNEVGAVPADVELQPGKHAVVVRHDDYEEADTIVIIDAGATRLHHVELVPVPPIYERWWFWGGIGAVSATAAVVVVAAVLEGPVEQGNIEPGVVSAPLVTIAAF